MRLFVGPPFSQLRHNPESIGISGHIEVQNLTPVVADDEKASEASPFALPFAVRGRTGLLSAGLEVADETCLTT